MLDIKFLREHPDIVKENIKKKFKLWVIVAFFVIVVEIF